MAEVKASNQVDQSPREVGIALLTPDYQDA
jgi:hypothetical protein